MVTLDRIKILTDKKHIKRIDLDVITKVLRNNIGIAIRYTKKNAFQYYIDYSLQVTDVLSNSLRKYYLTVIQTININNIQQCF